MFENKTKKFLPYNLNLIISCGNSFKTVAVSKYIVMMLMILFRRQLLLNIIANNGLSMKHRSNYGPHALPDTINASEKILRNLIVKPVI